MADTWVEDWVPAEVPPNDPVSSAFTQVRNLTVEVQRLRHAAFYLHDLVMGSMQEEAPIDGRSAIVRLVLERYNEAMGSVDA